MVIKLQHTLSKDESQICIKNLLVKLREQYANVIINPKENWIHDLATLSFNLSNSNIIASMLFKESEVILDFKIPFFTRIFTNAIKTEIENRIKKCLAK